MNYKETIKFLYSCLPVYHRVGKAAYKANLDNTIALDDYLGNPHQRFPSVHIAGTNGKGSVAHMMSSVLQEAGFRTGLYTSPHLIDFRERIKINGIMIPEPEVVRFVHDHGKIIRSMSPSFFELTVAMAFDYFARHRVDIAVIETGMGGRLDSTNIITPLLSVITNIGHDHMEFLGDTIAKVAAEKAGIIKPLIPVVIGESAPETDPVFKDAALTAGSDIWFASSNYDCHLARFDPAEGIRKYRVTRLTDGVMFRGMIPLPGDYQKHNLVTLYQAMEIIPHQFRPKKEHLLRGISSTVSSTGLQGRWQILRQDPLVICDTAHNMEGLTYVLNQLRGVRYDRLHIVMGFVNDKDLSSVLPLFPRDATYYFTRASLPRALDENVLKESALEYGLKGTSYNDVPAAYRAALGSAGINDLVFVGGSTFVVAEIV
ncbi:MAG: folylpolyglutamate synthase/dihydrofolate synthase family protein [Bacteroidales bacterium]